MGSSSPAASSNPFALLGGGDEEEDDAVDLPAPAVASTTAAPKAGAQKAASAKTSTSGKGTDAFWAAMVAAPARDGTAAVDVAAPAAPASKPSPALKGPLVWIDLEMTGLSIDQDTIIEIACLVTDGDLAITIEGPSLAVHHDDTVLDSMNAWCIEHHGQSGLTQRVRDSTVDMRSAELQVLAFIREHIPIPGSAQLAGSSIHQDRMFLNKFMPELLEHLNYRVVDVSSVRELARRWYPMDYKRQPRKASAHTALADIHESLAELKYYRGCIFKRAPQDKEGSGGGGSAPSSYKATLAGFDKGSKGKR